MMKKIERIGYWNEENYFNLIDEDVKKSYDIANSAKKNGFDFMQSVETPLAMSMAEKCVSLIATMYPELPVDNFGILKNMAMRYWLLAAGLDIQEQKEKSNHK